MADIFHEIDEEVRREQYQKLWARYGNYVIVAALLVVGGVGGWRAYEYWEAKKAAETGAAFEAAVALAEQGKTQDADAAFAKLAEQSPPGYRSLARLRLAADLSQRDPKAAIAAYDALAGDSTVDSTLRAVASLRSAFLLLETNAFNEVRSKLEPLSGPSETFRHTAREMLALAAWRSGDMTAARRWAEMAMGDAETPQSLRARMEMLLALVPAAGNG